MLAPGYAAPQPDDATREAIRTRLARASLPASIADRLNDVVRPFGAHY
jgi:hypothetical protein